MSIFKLVLNIINVKINALVYYVKNYFIIVSHRIPVPVQISTSFKSEPAQNSTSTISVLYQYLLARGTSTDELVLGPAL
jgi:hypothetical protein